MKLKVMMWCICILLSGCGTVTNRHEIEAIFNDYQYQFNLPQLQAYPAITSVEVFEEGSWERVFLTKDKPDDVRRFYEALFVKPEWEVSNFDPKDHPSNRSWRSNIRLDQNLVVLRFTEQNNYTRVSLRIWTQFPGITN